MNKEILNDAILQEDLENIATSDIPWGKFDGKNVLITGATGLVGAALTRALCAVNRIHGLKIGICIFVRNKNRAADLFGELVERESIKIIEGDICDKIETDIHIDYIIHTAAITNSKMMVTQPVETIMTSINGTKNILDFAKEQNVKSIVYLSSMEAYGKPSEGNEYVHETDYGYIDILNVRSCYPESKRMTECLCSCYSAEYGVPVKIARLAQTFGAGITEKENRVFAQFARSFINGNDIVLHTTGESFGNYCYTAECVTALFFLLLNGKDGEAYNVTNENTNIMIRDMAQMIADMSDGKIKLVFDIPEDALKYGYAPAVKMRLSSDKLTKLGWEAKIDLPEMYQRLIQSMKNTNNY